LSKKNTASTTRMPETIPITRAARAHERARARNRDEAGEHALHIIDGSGFFVLNHHM